MDTNGVTSERKENGHGKPLLNGTKHAEKLHEGYFLSDKAKVAEADGSQYSVFFPFSVIADGFIRSPRALGT